MLEALKVSMGSLLCELSEFVECCNIHVYSADLSESDMVHVRAVLDRQKKSYSLELHRITLEKFEGFPELQSSVATYMRLIVPDLLGVDKYLYVDADTLCRVDMLPLYQTDLTDYPVAMVPEARMEGTVDRRVAEQLGFSTANSFYFNAGVALVNARVWREQKLSEKMLQYIVKNSPDWHDQSAINYCLNGRIKEIDGIYNIRTNAREYWHVLAGPSNGKGRLLHFIDYPKPWSPLGRMAHPFGVLWRQQYKELVGKRYRCKQTLHLRSAQNRKKYFKMWKDSVLFHLYDKGLYKSVKGTNSKSV